SHEISTPIARDVTIHDDTKSVAISIVNINKIFVFITILTYNYNAFRDSVIWYLSLKTMSMLTTQRISNPLVIAKLVSIKARLGVHHKIRVLV
ncbi:hypothetical protein ACFLUJ_04265, partial [Chloroflexota bacterium]